MYNFRGVDYYLHYLKYGDYHLFSEAGMGKTHIAANFCQERLQNDLPALLLLGQNFSGATTLTEHFRQILDIPPTYSWSDFIQALNIAAKTYKTRIPIFIDGLNETVSGNCFSPIWKNELPSFIHELNQYSQNLVLITTCRDTYKDAIWKTRFHGNFLDLESLDSYEVENIVKKYFDYCRIR